MTVLGSIVPNVLISLSDGNYLNPTHGFIIKCHENEFDFTESELIFECSIHSLLRAYRAYS